jgi:hypothetical protein
MFRYKLHELDGSEVGEAEYAVLIQPGEIIWANGNRAFLAALRVTGLSDAEGLRVSESPRLSQSRQPRCPR